MGSSFVTIAGSRVTSSRYISWEDTRIKLQLPYNVQDGLVKVVTSSGESAPAFFANRSNIPVEIRTDPKTTLPLISSIEPENPVPGDTITITGSNFGSAKGSSCVYFTANREFRSPETDRYIKANSNDFAYEYWTDNEIHVRIPDGATSGQLVIETQKGKSQNFPFKMSFPVGNKSYTAKRTYVVTTAIDIQNEKDVLTSEITLYMARPPVFSSQPNVQNNETKPEPLVQNDRFNIIFQSTLMSGLNAKQSFYSTNIIDIYEVASKVEEKKVPVYSAKTLSLYKPYLTQDNLIPSTSAKVVSLAEEIIGKEKNPYIKAKLIYNYMCNNFKIKDTLRKEGKEPVDVIRWKSGDAYDFAVLYTALCRSAGIPAIPMGGILVEDKNTTHSHWWTEIYLEKFGWLPVDVAVGAGLKYENFPRTEDARSYYFGNIDNQHITFSRGWKEIKPSLANNKITQRPRSYALQSIWEESSGKDTNYSSFWSEPIIVGIY